jgi:hypothetical protein
MKKKPHGGKEEVDVHTYPSLEDILGSLYIRERRPTKRILGIIEQFDTAGYAQIAFDGRRPSDIFYIT